MSSITNTTVCIWKSFQLGQPLIAASLIALIGHFPLVYVGVSPHCQGEKSLSSSWEQIFILCCLRAHRFCLSFLFPFFFFPLILDTHVVDYFMLLVPTWGTVGETRLDLHNINLKKNNKSTITKGKGPKWITLKCKASCLENGTSNGDWKA